MENRLAVRRTARFVWAGFMVLVSIVIGYAFSALGLGDTLGYAFGCFVGAAIWLVGFFLVSVIFAGRPK